MKAVFFIAVVSLMAGCYFTSGSVKAQNDSMYIMRSGAIIDQFKLSEIDSIIFKKPGTGAFFQCGGDLVISHVAGLVAPVDKSTTYGTVTNIPGEVDKCWITSNLGSDCQAISLNDSSEPAAGWYWQFNRKQGYKHDGTNRTPNTTWITSINENSGWLTTNDPCNLELGAAWRLPTYTEWYNVNNTGGWANWNGPWSSGLKLHAAGYLYFSNGSLHSRGSRGYCWSSTEYNSSLGWYLYFYSGISSMISYSKADGFSVRCLRDI